jgi:hypothetical protein
MAMVVMAVDTKPGGGATWRRRFDSPLFALFKTGRGRKGGQRRRRRSQRGDQRRSRQRRRRRSREFTEDERRKVQA